MNDNYKIIKYDYNYKFYIAVILYKGTIIPGFRPLI